MMLKTKRKVGIAGASNDTPPPSSKRKSSGDGRSLRKLFINFGASVESLIDATPFGVSTPAPWSPSTDKQKALLSDPMSVLNDTVGGAAEDGASWTRAPSQWLAVLREGLANVAPLEEAFAGATAAARVPADVRGRVAPAADAVVPSDAGCEAFVAVGADRWGNTARVVHPVLEVVAEAQALQRSAASKIAAFVEKVQLRASGIVVTSDDCSADCSLFSLAEDHLRAYSPSSPVPGSVSCDDSDFEDVPSVVTEIMEELVPTEEMEELEPTEKMQLEPAEDINALPTEVVATKEDQPPKAGDQSLKAALEDLVNEEDEWVLT